MLQYKEDLKKSADKNIKVKESSDSQSIDTLSNNDLGKDNKIIKDKGARLILLFEEHASDFGTNAFKSICWILFITFIFEWLLYIYTNSYNEQFNTGWANIINSYIYSLNPLNHMKDILSPYMTSSSPDLTNSNIVISVFGIFNFIKNIFVGVLIYETIKSFRRFSRKL